MSFAVNHLVGFGARRASAAPIAVQFTDSKSTTGTATATYTACNIGTASADRLVVVVCTGIHGSTRTLSSVTIGGNTATVHASSGSGAGQESVGIASLVVPSGTTADIVVTWSAAPSNNGIMVWIVTGWSSSTPYSSYANADGTSATTKVATLDTIAGGILIVGAGHGANDTCSWSSVTEDADFQVNSAAARMSGGSKTGLTTVSSATETATWSGSQHNSIAAAVWQ